MPEFQCTVMICAGQNLIVEAENEVQAAENAEEIFENNHSGLCHQCAKETDLGDCYGVLVASIDGSQILLETDAKSVTIRAQRDMLGARGFELARLRHQLDVQLVMLRLLEHDFTLMLQMAANEFGPTERATLRGRLVELRKMLKDTVEPSEALFTFSQFVDNAASIIEAEQERLSGEDYLMDSDDCIKVLREAKL